MFEAGIPQKIALKAIFYEESDRVIEQIARNYAKKHGMSEHDMQMTILSFNLGDPYDLH